MARRRRSQEAARERRRELDRIRTQVRRMQRAGFHAEVGDLSDKTLGQLKKITIERLSNMAIATEGQYAGKLTYSDYRRMNAKARKQYQETGELPTLMRKNIKRRKNKLGPLPKKEWGPGPGPEPGPEEEPVPPMGDILLDSLYHQIAEAKRKKEQDPWWNCLAEEVEAALARFIAELKEDEVKRRLVKMNLNNDYVDLYRYTYYIARGEEQDARQSMETLYRYMDAAPSKEDRRRWDDYVETDGILVDPITGEPIT